MRNASSFQRQGRPRTRVRGAWAAGAWIASFALGCLFQLDDVIVPASGGMNGIGGAGEAGTGGTGASAGEASVGGTGGTGSTDLCQPGFKDCGQGCEPFAVANGCGRDTCSPCAQPARASVSCDVDTGNCRFDECLPGFADCDADMNGYTGEAAPGGVELNGCEYEFTPGNVLSDPTPPLVVPQVSIDIGDGSRADWEGIPAYPLVAICENCEDPTLFPVVAQNDVPPRRDLEAYFRVAWDNTFFYVLGDVYDSDLFKEGISIDDGRCTSGEPAPGAPCEDGLTVFFDGRNDRAVNHFYGNDDMRIFLGTSDAAIRLGGTPPQGQQLDLKATLNGNACYRVEAKIAWTFIVATNSDLPGLFPPAAGQEYGFDLSVNDWDRGVSDQTPVRESQLFWVNPGTRYDNESRGFGGMRLSDPTGAGGTGNPQ